MLGKKFGINGIWAAFAVSGLITILIALAINIPNAIKTKKFTLFPIPESVEKNKDNTLGITITKLEQVSPSSEKIQAFCTEHGIDLRRSMYVALCFEEMATNTVTYGFARTNKECSLDARVAIVDNKITLRLRDNCLRFDAVAKYNSFVFDPEKPEKGIGIRMTMKLAKDIKYVDTFGLNNLTITVE